jgi:acyl homoserine lactone synthase
MLYYYGKQGALSPQLWESMGRYRRKVFVNHLGWRLSCSDEIESDEFDGPDAIYVCSQDGCGQVNGVSRLLPTTAPYLLEKIFPSLWAGAHLPHSSEIWELSRFAAVDFDNFASQTKQVSARHAASLFQYVLRVAAECGARALVTVSPVGVERLFRINGFRARRIGVPRMHEGVAIVGLEIRC